MRAKVEIDLQPKQLVRVFKTGNRVFIRHITFANTRLVADAKEKLVTVLAELIFNPMRSLRVHFYFLTTCRKLELPRALAQRIVVIKNQHRMLVLGS